MDVHLSFSAPFEGIVSSKGEHVTQAHWKMHLLNLIFSSYEI